MYCVKLQKKTEDVYIGLYCLSQTKWLRIDILDPNLPYISTTGGRAERAGDRNASAWAGGAHMSVMMSTTSTLYLFQVTCHELCKHGEGSSFLPTKLSCGDAAELQFRDAETSPNSEKAVTSHLRGLEGLRVSITTLGQPLETIACVWCVNAS